MLAPEIEAGAALTALADRVDLTGQGIRSSLKMQLPAIAPTRRLG